MQTQDRRIRRVSRDISEKVIERMTPRTLRQHSMEEIMRHALPRDLNDIYLGPADDALEISLMIVQGIFQTIHTRGNDLSGAPTLKDVANKVKEGVYNRLNKLGRVDDAETIKEKLDQAFSEHPSLLDRITGSVLPDFDGTRADVRRIESDIEQCVLKIIDRKECWTSTAFALCGNGHILTAAHVFKKGNPIGLTFGSGDECPAQVVVKEVNEDMDIALLRIDRDTLDELQGKGLKPLSSLQSVSLGQQGFLFGVAGGVNQIVEVLCAGKVPDELRGAFSAHDRSLSQDASVTQQGNGEWLLTSPGEGFLIQEQGGTLIVHQQGEDSLRGEPMLCVGYQAQSIQQTPAGGGTHFMSLAPVEATVARYFPRRTIGFYDSNGNIVGTQDCLVLLITEDGERIGRGMSGGPILNSRGEVIAMITAAQALHQPYNKRWEVLPLAEYGFGVPIGDIAGSCPEFKDCCLTGNHHQGGHNVD